MKNCVLALLLVLPATCFSVEKDKDNKSEKLKEARVAELVDKMITVSNVQGVETALALGFDVNKSAPLNHATVLHKALYAAQGCLRPTVVQNLFDSACTKDTRDMIALLLKAKANPNTPRYVKEEVQFPLSLAVSTCDALIVEMLLAAGAHPALENESIASLLSGCSEKQVRNITTLLMKYNA